MLIHLIKNLNTKKKEIEGKLMKLIQEDEELKKYMKARKIDIPNYLKEFYIDSIDYEAENNNQINTMLILKVQKMKY